MKNNLCQATSRKKNTTKQQSNNSLPPIHGASRDCSIKRLAEIKLSLMKSLNEIRQERSAEVRTTTALFQRFQRSLSD